MTSFIKNKNESVIAVCGPVDAGKSSLIGVLTSGELDDGRGKSRNKILKHKHELETGRTSNITFNPLKYKKTNVNRGMKVFYDAIDWLGGYPYESATSNNIIQSLKGYNLIKIINDEPPFLFGIFGSGCAEYVFTKKD